MDYVDSLPVQRRATELGERMEREDGLDTAVQEIEKLVGR